jgi:beta-lactamase regulating signal transducer with metallopeptidase domain
MHADRSLYAIGLFFTFFVRVAVVWLFCLIFSRILRKPNHRFTLWLIFSAGSLVYWMSVLAALIYLPSGGTVALHGNSFEHIAVSSSWEPVFAAVTWLLAGGYLIGLTMLFASRVLNRLRLRKLLQFGSRPSPEFVAALEQVRLELGVRPCELLILPGIVSPATVYWLKPRILFPENFHESERMEEFLHIMRHELTHIIRRDYLVSSLIDGACTLLFFHPALWAARKRMRIERELACDRAVVEACPDHRADYAASLAQFVRLSMSPRRSAPEVQFAAPSSLLGRRIRSILLEPVALPQWNRMCSAGLAATMVMTLLLFAPQMSVSFDLVTGIARRQFASMNVEMPGHRMKRHIRFDYPEQDDETVTPYPGR